jgi:hypothetical protein
MSASYERQSRHQATRRRFFFKLILYIFAALFLLVAAILFYVTQPVWRSKAERKTRVDPGRLEAYVRMLAESLSPRSESHTENLDAAAAYIRQEFENTRRQIRRRSWTTTGWRRSWKAYMRQSLSWGCK